jgi:hypothetical protein
MSVKLTIDLENLSPERAQQIAGLICMFAEGALDTKTDPVVTSKAELEFDPKSAFVSEQGPTLDIPPQVIMNNAVFGKMASIPDLTINPTVTSPVVLTSNTIDSSGLPWDARIHSGTRGLNGDGTWRLKRGVSKPEVEQVTAELRKLMAIPSPGPQLVQAAPVAPVAPPPPVPTVTDRHQKFVALFGRVIAATSEGKLTDEQTRTCLQSIGIPTLPQLAVRLDLVDEAARLIDAVIAGQSAQ